MPKNNKSKETLSDYEDDGWIVEAWINSTKAGKVLAVSKPQTKAQKKKGESGELIGFVSVNGLKKVIKGQLNGIPIKSPPEDDEDDDDDF